MRILILTLVLLIVHDHVQCAVVTNHGLYGIALRLRTLGSTSHVLHTRLDKTIWTHYDMPYDSRFVRGSIMRVLQGLSGYGAVTFEGVQAQGFYLHAPRPGGISMRSYQRTQKFREEASFVVHAGLAGQHGVSFESVRYPGWYLRRVHGRVKLSRFTRVRRFRLDATWKLEQAMFKPRT